MSKLNEADICRIEITPAIIKAGWDSKKQIKEQYFFTDGKINVYGKRTSRGDRKKADYILFYKPNIPIAIVEAKNESLSLGSGMQQALDYADILDIPFVYSSNGSGFLEHDKTVNIEKDPDRKIEKELSLDKFPSPNELWERYKIWKGIDEKKEGLIKQEYFFELEGRTPRYYQRVAINRTIEAISNGQDRIILVMATGTGKTYTAFQIIYKLWKSGTKKRILFLADRNILIDQTMSGDFKHFGDKMVKIKNRKFDKAHEIYLALYQGLTGEDDTQNIYKQFSKEFFDLIIVDECHRGSAREDSRWREVLTYFHKATHIGLTATPKETKEISNLEYFGDPIYTYSLKQGIEDGFLAPYKVIRIHIDKDVEGYRPEQGKLDKKGKEIEDREYNLKDFDRTLVLENRIKLVAKRVSDILKKNNERFSKSIFFCVDIEHAEKTRQELVNQNGDLVSENRKYVMKITGDDKEGKKELDNFIDPEQRYPTLVTTSKLLTTGVDAKTCKFIILDSNINSMTEFKQIIGRGTRIDEDNDKRFFTIIDFRNVTKHFADEDFDGPPIMIKEPIDGEIPDINESPEVDENGDEIENEEETGENGNDNEFPDFDEEEDGNNKIRKFYVDDVEVNILKERVQYLDPITGKLITTSLKDYTKLTVLNKYSSLDKFFEIWQKVAQKNIIIEEFKKMGIVFEELIEDVNKDLDAFDLICHIAYDKKPLTRKERANKVKKRDYFGKYEDKARGVLEQILMKYENEGLKDIENISILKIDPFSKFGSPIEIIKSFGGKNEYLKAIKELEDELYVV